MGIEGESLNNSFQISSNPAARGNTAELQVGLSAGAEVTVRVFDVSGKVVDSCGGHLTEGCHRVSLDALPSGVYMAELIAEDFHSSRRFLVLR